MEGLTRIYSEAKGLDMTDIVRDLRAIADAPGHLSTIASIAADEIERLRASEQESFQKYVDANEALIDARQIIKAIAEWSDEEDEWDGRDKFHTIRDMARSALNQQKRDSE